MLYYLLKKMMVIKEPDNRKFQRVNSILRLRYQIRGFAEFGNSVTKDISVGGLRFISDRYIKPATDVELEIDVLSKVINTIAKVRWSQSLPHSNRYHVGLEFVELEANHRHYLSDYIGLKQS